MIHLRYKGWQYNGHWYTLKKNKLPFLCTQYPSSAMNVPTIPNCVLIRLFLVYHFPVWFYIVVLHIHEF